MLTFKSTPQEIWKEGILPFFIQSAIILTLVAIFYFGVNAGPETFIVPQHQEGGELTKPTLGRCIYMMVSLTLGLFTAFRANSVGKVLESNRKMFQSYYIGIISGTLLWQSIGECSWHFGIQFFSGAMGEIVTVYFPRIECISSLFLFALILMLICYSWRKKVFSWGIWCVIISFMANWIGHFIMLASYPFVSQHFPEPVWYRIIGLWGGLLIVLYSLSLMLFKVHNIRGRLSASMMIYCGIGMFISAYLE